MPHSFASFANEWGMETFPIAELVVRTICDLQWAPLKVYPHRTWFAIIRTPEGCLVPSDTDYFRLGVDRRLDR